MTTRALTTEASPVMIESWTPALTPTSSTGANAGSMRPAIATSEPLDVNRSIRGIGMSLWANRRYALVPPAVTGGQATAWEGHYPAEAGFAVVRMVLVAVLCHSRPRCEKGSRPTMGVGSL